MFLNSSFDHPPASHPLYVDFLQCLAIPGLCQTLVPLTRPVPDTHPWVGGHYNPGWTPPCPQVGVWCPGSGLHLMHSILPCSWLVWWDGPWLQVPALKTWGALGEQGGSVRWETGWRRRNRSQKQQKANSKHKVILHILFSGYLTSYPGAWFAEMLSIAAATKLNRTWTLL